MERRRRQSDAIRRAPFERAQFDRAAGLNPSRVMDGNAADERKFGWRRAVGRLAAGFHQFEPGDGGLADADAVRAAVVLEGVERDRGRAMEIEIGDHQGLEAGKAGNRALPSVAVSLAAVSRSSRTASIKASPKRRDSSGCCLK